MDKRAIDSQLRNSRLHKCRVIYPAKGRSKRRGKAEGKSLGIAPGVSPRIPGNIKSEWQQTTSIFGRYHEDRMPGT